MFNSDKAYEIRNDGLIIDGGVHYISGPLVPSHIPTVPTIYDLTTNGARYFNEGTGGSWVLLNGSAGPSFDVDTVLTDNFFDTLVDNEGNLLIGA